MGRHSLQTLAPTAELGAIIVIDGVDASESWSEEWC